MMLMIKGKFPPLVNDVDDKMISFYPWELVYALNNWVFIPIDHGCHWWLVRPLNKTMRYYPLRTNVCIWTTSVHPYWSWMSLVVNALKDSKWFVDVRGDLRRGDDKYHWHRWYLIRSALIAGIANDILLAFVSVGLSLSAKPPTI